MHAFQCNESETQWIKCQNAVLDCDPVIRPSTMQLNTMLDKHLFTLWHADLLQLYLTSSTSVLVMIALGDAL